MATGLPRNCCRRWKRSGRVHFRGARDYRLYRACFWPGQRCLFLFSLGDFDTDNNDNKSGINNNIICGALSLNGPGHFTKAYRCAHFIPFTNTHTHTHACTQARRHAGTHTTNTCLTGDWLAEKTKKETISQYAEEKRWVFSFNIKEKKQYLTERGRELQMTGPMYLKYQESITYDDHWTQLSNYTFLDYRMQANRSVPDSLSFETVMSFQLIYPAGNRFFWSDYSVNPPSVHVHYAVWPVSTTLLKHTLLSLSTFSKIPLSERVLNESTNVSICHTPEVGQKTAFHASPAVGNSVFL